MAETTWWMATSWSFDIDAVSVVSETEQYVSVKSGGRDVSRMAKVAQSHIIAPDYDTARSWLVEQHVRKVQVARRELERAISALDRAKKLRTMADLGLPPSTPRASGVV